jgi:hypothetical protein
LGGAASAAPLLFWRAWWATSMFARNGTEFGGDDDVGGGIDMELTAAQMKTLERLFEAGFRPIAIPPYENALCVHREECAALLAPVANGGLREVAPPTLLVDGNLSVRLKKKGGDVFVWKKAEVPATEEMLKKLEEFRYELAGILELGETQ